MPIFKCAAAAAAVAVLVPMGVAQGPGAAFAAETTYPRFVSCAQLDRLDPNDEKYVALYTMYCTEESAAMRSAMARLLSISDAARRDQEIDKFFDENTGLYFRMTKAAVLQDARYQAVIRQIGSSLSPYLFPETVAAAKKAASGSIEGRRKFVEEEYPALLAKDRANSKELADRAAKVQPADRAFVKRLAERETQSMVASAARTALERGDVGIAAFLDGGGLEIATFQDSVYMKGQVSSRLAEFMKTFTRQKRIAEVAEAQLPFLNGEALERQKKIVAQAWKDVAATAAAGRKIMSDLQANIQVNAGLLSGALDGTAPATTMLQALAGMFSQSGQSWAQIIATAQVANTELKNAQENAERHAAAYPVQG